ncbi:MAG: sigma 54-interacting transcriptional regulator [Myxococcota bacterium]|nr:sigma 54-interacting transcriptional regulator [Myxococcota bacterium]
MNPIRSILWVGSADGLARSGGPQSPTLDITWVRDVPAAYALPPMTLDAAVVAGPAAESLTKAIRELVRRPGSPPILAWLEPNPSPGSPDDEARAIRSLLAAGALDVLLGASKGDAAGNAGALLRRLDAFAKQQPTARLPEEVSPQGASLGIIGRSDAMRDVHALAQRAAHSRATVLLQGETGTGKELVGRLIHDLGDRRQAAYVAINCAAFPESLLEGELFGHRKGAFTGADRDRAGHIERAHRGTLFLDEIAETSASLQAKLLRVLQEREVLPVGGARPRPVDIRVITATHRDLLAETRAGRFREDLYYRLAVFPIALPPLRERPSDILELAEHFLERHGKREQKPGCSLSAAARRLLLAHPWPGNVRELENEIQRALALAEPGERMGPRLLSDRLTGLLEAIAQAPPAEENLQASLSSIEAWLIRRALENNGGRRALTARKLGVTREGLYKKMKRLGIG